MKIYKWLLLTLILLIPIFTACGGAAPPAENQAETTDAGAPAENQGEATGGGAAASSSEAGSLAGSESACIASGGRFCASA